MTGWLVPVLPAASVSLATSAFVPCASATEAAQVPFCCTTPVPMAVVPPLSNTDTVVPASATSTVPAIVWAAWLVGPPGLVIATAGAVVSMVKPSATCDDDPVPLGLVWLAKTA